ncbi:ubiquinone/menaquinone biosynthesis methyltransferase [Deferribacter desulfuricans SSM1]|uniref:Demethylmenaquinone methyltransferase n=1 Tax=Deferribacter desulfuricans (strain DSM 14783 / JCM 11476 / NBRC 101012 / SSM1) TaxID=639282 RepID=D3P8Q9_DEFDS|nr:bifunctional demethylmenaquinone methyltransferase/2-methoxy-6-polyprenyl-1,4-benzoquinol methylase UbiE [Deferribacter desulfuricans]BAI81099.1 ubiquinone/menaquinone biosynthesis methyltransferase [Deferribacter desulfuricans SSM1]
MNEQSKKIQGMFDSIAGKYDLLNRLLSFRRDVYWRKKAISLLKINEGSRILDLACGTGDMLLELKKMKVKCNVIGGDFSFNMLMIAKKKLNDLPLTCADAHFLPFKDESFDYITIAFGFRNVTDKEKGLKEMYRVLKKGGKACILEFSQPDNKFFSKVYRFYFTKVLPFIGGLISGNRSAYEYLPDSVYKFPKKDKYEKMILSAGFKKVEFNPLTFNICDATICYK